MAHLTKPGILFSTHYIFFFLPKDVFSQSTGYTEQNLVPHKFEFF